MRRGRLSAGDPASMIAWSLMLGTLVLLPVPLVMGASHTQIGLIIAALLVLFAAILGMERLGHAMMILAFATVPWNAVNAIGHASYFVLSNVLLALAFALLLGRLVAARLRMPLLFTVGAFWFVLVCLTAAATQAGEWSHTFDAVLGVVLVPVLVVWWRPSYRVVVASAVAYVIGNSISIAYALAAGSAHRQAGLSSHPNALGTCCALALALMPFLWASTTSKLLRWLLVLAAVFNAYGINVTGSRAALLCVVILVALYPLLSRSPVAALAVGALSVPALIIVTQAGQHSSTKAVGRLLGGGDVSGANHARVTGLQDGLTLVIHHPILGVGWSRVWEAHDIYVEAAAAVGVIGLACLILILVASIAPLVRVHGRNRWLSYPALGAALIGFVDPAIGARYIWAPLALAFCASRLAREAGDEAVPSQQDPVLAERRTTSSNRSVMETISNLRSA